MTKKERGQFTSSTSYRVSPNTLVHISEQKSTLSVNITFTLVFFVKNGDFDRTRISVTFLYLDVFGWSCYIGTIGFGD